MKSLLKKIKLNESTISMILGAIVIVVVGVLVVNYFRGLDSGNTLPAVETETDEVSLPTTHTVQKGEDLWSISEQYYQNGYNWVDIAEANELSSPGNIAEGQELTIPDVEPRVADASITPEATAEPTVTSTPEVTVEATITPEPTTTPDETEVVLEETDEAPTANEISGESYTVVKGDNLWDIAVRAYGDGYKWTEIAKANKLVNPGIIHSGNVFVLPR